MLLRCFGRYKYVVDIDEDPWNVAEDSVHEALEVLASIFKSERRSWKDEEPKGGDDACFADVFIGDRNLKIAF